MPSSSIVRLSALVIAPVLLVGAGLWVQVGGDGGSRSGTRYVQRPPLGHTGGFGEPTCQVCHFGSEVNEGGGQVAVKGMPASVRAGETYRLTVTLTDSMERSGFMLSVRHSDGTQAGRLFPSDSTRVDVRGAGAPEVLYAHHTEEGTELTEPNRAVWSVRWRASKAAGDSVLVHVSANAANDDASSFGDDIYTAVERTKVASVE